MTVANAVVDLWWIDTVRVLDVDAAIRAIVTLRGDGPPASRRYIGTGRKPRFARDSARAVSIAHAPGYSVCAVGRGDAAIGVDCEPVVSRLGMEWIAARLGLDPSASLRAIYRAWVCFEAAGKALGMGLGIGPADLRPAPPGAGARSAGGRDLAIVEVAAPAGHVAAVAAVATAVATRNWNFNERFVDPSDDGADRARNVLHEHAEARRC